MENVRCRCGKMVCQLKAKVVLIRCRHCKKNVIVEFNNQEAKEELTANKEYHSKIEYK